MLFSEDKIEKILGYKTWSDRQKISELLHMDCSIYANIGIESSVKEKEEARKNSRKIYYAIKKLDPVMGSSFISLMDKK
jgi:hypothetical protein